MILAFSIAPMGEGEIPLDNASTGSVTEAVAAAVRVVRESGLPNTTSSMFTEVEGTWDECFGVLKAATDAVLPYGARITITMKADIRPGTESEMTAKLARLESKI